jgi:hypothetical protein
MLREAEWPSIRDAHRLEQPIAQQKASVIHGNDGLRFGQKMSVEKDEHAHF